MNGKLEDIDVKHREEGGVQLSIIFDFDQDNHHIIIHKGDRKRLVAHALRSLARMVEDSE